MDTKPWVGIPVNAPLVEDDHDGEQEVVGEEGGLGQHLHNKHNARGDIKNSTYQYIHIFKFRLFIFNN